MRLSILKAVVFLLLLSNCVTAQADSVLVGTVSFDGGTGLYTYSYTIDNTAGPVVGIGNIAIIVDTNPFEYPFPPFPVPNTEPTGWNFGGAWTGTGPGTEDNPPFNEVGDIYGFDANPGPIPVETTLSGFTFSVPVPPTMSLANDYFIFSPDYLGPGTTLGGLNHISGYGYVVAPDFASVTATTPIPAAFPLFATGLGVMGLFGWRRKRKVQTAA